MKPAVFLDKDGTLIEDVPYNVDPERIVLAKGAREGCEALHAGGYSLVVVTNQSGIARGLFGASALDAVEQRLRDLIGVPLLGFYHCPHDDRHHCACRKPSPGMILQAARDHDLDLAASWMVGDILNDVEAGNRAGTRSILIDNGGETQWIDGLLRRPTVRVSDMVEAALTILCDQRMVA